MIIGLKGKKHGELTWEQAIHIARVDGNLEGFSFETIWEFSVSCRRTYQNVPLSMLFNSGMRKSLLEYLVDHYVSVRSMWPALRGTLIHRSRAFALVPNEGVLRELELSAMLPSGVWVTGHPDKYDPRTETVTDFKTSSAKSSKWPMKFHVGQVSGYGWLIEKSGLPVSHYELDYISWYCERVIEVEPWERAGMIQFMERRAKAIRQALDQRIIPDEMYCNEKFCQYCALRGLCKANPGQFILPEEDDAEDL